MDNLCTTTRENAYHILKRHFLPYNIVMEREKILKTQEEDKYKAFREATRVHYEEISSIYREHSLLNIQKKLSGALHFFTENTDLFEENFFESGFSIIRNFVTLMQQISLEGIIKDGDYEDEMIIFFDRLRRKEIEAVILPFINNLSEKIGEELTNESSHCFFDFYHILSNHLRLSLGTENWRLSLDSIFSYLKATETLTKAQPLLRESKPMIDDVKTKLLLWRQNETALAGRFPTDTINLSEFFPRKKERSDGTYSDEIRAEEFEGAVQTKSRYREQGFTDEDINTVIKILKKSTGERLLQDVLQRYHLDGETLLKTWKGSPLSLCVDEHVEVIETIEKTHEGSAKQLMEGPGQIRCFGRYDSEFLLEQLKPLEPGEPFGVMCNSYEDHSGAFMGREDTHSAICLEAKSLGIKTRIFEYSTKRGTFASDFFQNLTRIAPPEDGEYIPHADFVWINQHGEIPGAKMQSKWEYIFGVGPNKSSLFLKSTGAVACAMCSGGDEGNVMELISEQYGLRTTGAKGETYGVSEVSFRKDEAENLHIDVKYKFYDGIDENGEKTGKYGYKKEETAG